jgi:hypothetical protein
MDFNSTIDIIIKDLREAREIIDDLKNYHGVPGIQIELAKSKCKSAEEVIATLKTSLLEADSKDINVERPMDQGLHRGKVEMVEEAEEVEEVEEVERVERVEKVEEIKAVVENQDQSLGTKPVKDSGKPVQKNPKIKSHETNILADQFSGRSNTFNEQLGNIKGDGDVSSVNKARPISNLFDAIGINDKFLFMREIFNGDQTSYNEAIGKLNKVDNVADARAVIMSYTGESDPNEAVTQLIDLVKRKLPSDE